jgi:hypothetical protein
MTFKTIRGRGAGAIHPVGHTCNASLLVQSLRFNGCHIVILFSALQNASAHADHQMPLKSLSNFLVSMQ